MSIMDADTAHDAAVFRERGSAIEKSLWEEFDRCFSNSIFTQKHKRCLDACSSLVVGLMLTTRVPMLFKGVCSGLSYVHSSIVAVSFVFARHLLHTWFSVANKRLLNLAELLRIYVVQNVLNYPPRTDVDSRTQPRACNLGEISSFLILANDFDECDVIT